MGRFLRLSAEILIFSTLISGPRIKLPAYHEPTPIPPCPISTDTSLPDEQSMILSHFWPFPVLPSPGRNELPAATDPDKNPELRGYEPVALPTTLPSGKAGPLENHGIPKLDTLLNRPDVIKVTSAGRVNKWNWLHSEPKDPIQDPPMTLIGIETTPGEPVYVPYVGSSIGGNTVGLALYVGENSLTVTFTGNDDVTNGLMVQLLGLCPNPILAGRYKEDDSQGRAFLPGLLPGQELAIARGDKLLVIARNTGAYQNPLSPEWWSDPSQVILSPSQQ